MNPAGISDEARSFILNNIESIGELEVLLLLNSDPRAEWDTPSVEAKLSSSEFAAKAHLDSLCSKNLALKISRTPLRYTFRPRNPKLNQVVSELARLYRTYQVAIIALIYDK